MRPSNPSIQSRSESIVRCFATTGRQNVAMPKDAPNMRTAPRVPIGALKAPIFDPADKYQLKADDLHKYGSWLMGCLPKFVQQFSVWKDELTIYICPTGAIPVFTFLKCMLSCSHAFSPRSMPLGRSC
jgi:NADH dehydrogenase (ubiquinone) Fe-S protein 3